MSTGTWIERTWTPAGGRGASAPYRAFVPAPIATLPVALGGEAITALVEASGALAVWSARPYDATLDDLLTRTEAVASSAFEQVTAAPAAVSHALLNPGSVRDENLRLILGNMAALERAARIGTRITAPDRPFTLADLLDIHRDLIAGTRPDGGCVRDQIVWIGGYLSTPLNANFVPPPPEMLGALLEDLAAFLRRTDVPSLWQAIIAHAQFETIHPFADGNGRTGRALMSTILTADSLATPPLSPRLLARPRAYIGALEDFRTGNLDGCVITFCSYFLGALSAATRAEQSYRSALEELAGILGPTRAGSSAQGALPLILTAPLTDIGTLALTLGVSFEAASRAVGQLVTHGILAPDNRNLRARRFRCPRGERLAREIA